MPGEAPARIETTSRSSCAGQPGMGVDDPARQLARGAGRSIELGPPVPLDEVGIERLDRAEQRDRRVDEPAEQRDTEAEVRRGDGRRVMPREQAVDERPVGGPAGRGDDEVADPGVERTGDVGRDRVAAGRLDHEVRAGERRGEVTSVGRSTEDVDGQAALAGAGGHGPSQAAVAEDGDGVHVVGPSLRVVEGRRFGRHEKAAVTVVVPRPLESPFPGGPGSSCRTRRLEPQGPCLPAGPPELLLRLLGEGVAVHVRTIRIFRI